MLCSHIVHSRFVKSCKFIAKMIKYLLIAGEKVKIFLFFFFLNFQWKILVVSFTSAFAQFTNCDYMQNMIIGQTYDIFSPGYGTNQFYPSGTNCRWRAVAPVNSFIRLNCFDMRLPQVSFIFMWHWQIQVFQLTILYFDFCQHRITVWIV